MAVFLGSTGRIRLRRNIGGTGASIDDSIAPDDVNTFLNRLGLQNCLDNLLTGDRVEISTNDARGLVCFDASNWPSAVVGPSITAFVNVNAVGGARFFETFVDAVNNTRANEYVLSAFAGSPLDVAIAVRNPQYNILGNVTSYEFNTTREAIDTTVLSEKYRTQYSAGLINGSGQIDCLFDRNTNGLTETPLFLLQTLQRLDIGSSCDLALFIVDAELVSGGLSVYYELEAVITGCGIAVDSENVIRCTVNFVTTGEIKLLVGEPVGFVLKEDLYRLNLEQSLDSLLLESED